MNIATEMKRLALRAAYNYLDKDPGANLPRLMEWVDARAEGLLEPQREVFRQIIREKDSNWYQLLESLWTDIDDEIRKTLFENLIINANLLAALQVRESSERYDCSVPWATALDMGVSCTSGGALSFDELDGIIEEGKNLGTFIYVLHGDGDLSRREEKVALCNKYQDCHFFDFINGKNVDGDLTSQLLRVKNYVPLLKTTGTDADRQVETAMKLFTDRKLAFGAFCFYDEKSQSHFAQEEFFDWLIRWGAKSCFFFSSVPADRDYLYGMMRLYRQSKPLLSINFCKDQDIIGGCLASRYYSAVDADGWVKPCPFVEERSICLREDSLVSAYQSRLFRSYLAENPVCKGVKGC